MSRMKKFMLCFKVLLCNLNGKDSTVVKLRDKRMQSDSSQVFRTQTATEAQQANENQLLELQALCRTLLQIAQKYVPDEPHAYSDAAAVIQCGRQLNHYGTAANEIPHFVAPTAAGNKRDLIVHSSEYRYLRNKAIAGFATIADLGAKMPTTGSEDFILGIRTGYRRASDLAVAFLDDVYSLG